MHDYTAPPSAWSSQSLSLRSFSCFRDLHVPCLPVFSGSIATLAVSAGRVVREPCALVSALGEDINKPLVDQRRLLLFPSNHHIHCLCSTRSLWNSQSLPRLCCSIAADNHRELDNHVHLKHPTMEVWHVPPRVLSDTFLIAVVAVVVVVAVVCVFFILFLYNLFKKFLGE